MRDNDTILVSVVVPVKNGDYWLAKTLKGILSQKIEKLFEVIVIDSGSTDLSLEIIHQFPVRLIQIAPEKFNHGTTRNLGAQEAVGEFVLMTVQDAQPLDEYWMQRLLDGFDEECVAAVCGQQIVPHDIDKNPVEWFRPTSLPSIIKYKFTTQEFEKLSPSVKRQICGWDDVTAMYRKTALMETPFREVMFAEDALWAKDALLKGYTIVYNQHARVHHYHLEDPKYTVKRLFTAHYHFYKYFGFTPAYVKTDILQKLKVVKLLALESRIAWSDKWKWFRYNVRVRKEINKAAMLFYQSLAEGENILEEKHNQLCKQIPQAIKPL
ncbi:glycosyltransferase family 2 protein [Pseudoflavitalea sp. X16]|uniref:glycosyltransferase family 2 protein n=1 Tax=Paraflavitalea devenefica TaxID=2716334 RepID=UPI00141D8E5C|nr:glycosyltransferase family 2 protein [Paraflavitalea devenefica]NII24095.1 glycosyltransferase family 2 protein [Paraflavitalea devenefica]